MRKRVAPKIPPAGKSRKRIRSDQQKDDETTSSDVGVAPVDSAAISIGVVSNVPVGVVSDIPLGVVSDVPVGVVSDVPVGVVSDVPVGVVSDISLEPMQLEVASNVEITVAMPTTPPINNDIHEPNSMTNDICEDTNNIHEAITAANDIHEEAEVVPGDERSVRSESVCSSVSRGDDEEDLSRCKRKVT